jgi:hypothetical protein
MMGQPGMQYGMGGQPGMMGGQQYGGMGQMGMMGAQPGMMPQQVSMLQARAHPLSRNYARNWRAQAHAVGSMCRA